MRKYDRTKPLWLPDLRRELSKDPTAKPLILRLKQLDGRERDFPCPLPGDDPELAEQMLISQVFNILAAYSGQRLSLYYDLDDPLLFRLAENLPHHFQLEQPQRSGLGKAMNIAGRLCRALSLESFRFESLSLGEYRGLPAEAAPPEANPVERLRMICDAANQGNYIGIDIGGTDIKLAASRKGRLLAVKEFDWNPALSPNVEEILEPILLLLRLMRLCIALEGDRRPPELQNALRKDARLEEMKNAVEGLESALGAGIQVLDGVGVSFPDIVIEDRILGGESPKTDAMRKNTARDYEEEFSRLSDLRTKVLKLCRPGGRCRISNDGNIAAFTAAAELALGDEAASVQDGIIAHSLGTDLGTGWLREDGSIPQIPLEMYDLLLDLGSNHAASYPPEDLRSTRNENSGLPGARRYMGQAAAYRLAWELEPSLLDGFTRWNGDLLEIAREPVDQRKPCLERLMAAADAGDPQAEEIFRRIGFHLSVVAREMDYLFSPKARKRFLFGRFVKSPHCFSLLREGFDRAGTGIWLEVADDSLANSPLMRQLARREDVTVAQFGQAIGSIYFALS